MPPHSERPLPDDELSARCPTREGETAVAVDPGEGALDNPPALAQLLAGLDARASCASSHLAAVPGLARTSPVVCFDGVELVRQTPRWARLAADRRDAVEQLLERHAVVGVRIHRDEGERDAAPFSDRMTFVPSLLQSIGFGPVLSIPFRQPGMRRRCRPGSSRSGRRPAAVAATCVQPVPDTCFPPIPQTTQARGARAAPISIGNISNWMPVRSTNGIPLNAARSGTRGRPLCGRCAAKEKQGAMTDHRACV